MTDVGRVSPTYTNTLVRNGITAHRHPYTTETHSRLKRDGITQLKGTHVDTALTDTQKL